MHPVVALPDNTPPTENFKEDTVQTFYDGVKHKPG
jgi:hypothetical protein